MKLRVSTTPNCDYNMSYTAAASIDNFITILGDASIKLMKRFSTPVNWKNDDRRHLGESNSNQANISTGNCESSGSRVSFT